MKEEEFNELYRKGAKLLETAVKAPWASDDLRGNLQMWLVSLRLTDSYAVEFRRLRTFRDRLWTPCS